MEVPIIMLKDSDVEKIISMWLGVDCDFVNTYLGIILSKLGFTNDDIIYVYGYNNDSYLLFRVNDNEEFCIRMSSNRDNPVIYFCKEDSEIGYECLFDKYRKFDLKLRLINDKVDDNKNIDINRDAIDSLSGSRDYIDYRVDNGYCVIELRLSKNCYYDRLKDRDKLFNYLSGLVYPVSIFDVYKNILEISLFDNISVFELIDLRILKWNNDYEDYKITDMITLSDGELVTVYVTNDGREIYSNSDCIWTSETDWVSIDFVTLKTDDSISYNTKVKPKLNMNYYTEELANEDVNSAKIEIAKVKRLIKNTFYKGDSK